MWREHRTIPISAYIFRAFLHLLRMGKRWLAHGLTYHVRPYTSLLRVFESLVVIRLAVRIHHGVYIQAPVARQLDSSPECRASPGATLLQALLIRALQDIHRVGLERSFGRLLRPVDEPFDATSLVSREKELVGIFGDEALAFGYRD